jgi:hypothetical protein
MILEKFTLYESCQANGYNINVESSGTRTSQCNGKVKRKFQTFYGRIRARLNNGGLENRARKEYCLGSIHYCTV